jgi:hypothetical protein
MEILKSTLVQRWKNCSWMKDANPHAQIWFFFD